MASIRELASRVRWRYILPLTLLVILFALKMQASLQYEEHFAKRDRICSMDGYNAPADVAAWSISAPSMLLSRVLTWNVGLAYTRILGNRLQVSELADLFCSTLLWFCVGIGFERNVQRTRTPLVRHRLARIALEFLGLVCFTISLCFSVREFLGAFATDVIEFRALGVWSLFLVAYFARKLWVEFRDRAEVTP